MYAPGYGLDRISTCADCKPDCWDINCALGTVKFYFAVGDVDVKRFLEDEQGQGLVEYALIIAVIAIGAIVAALFMKDQISNIFSTVGNQMT